MANWMSFEKPSGEIILLNLDRCKRITKNVNDEGTVEIDGHVVKGTVEVLALTPGIDALIGPRT